MAAAAADVDNAENVVLEGENTLDCAIAADFVDEGVGATVTNSKMRRMNFKPWADAINNVLAALRANKLMEISYTPEGASFLGSTRNLRAKNDAVDEIECHVVQLTVQDQQVQVLGVIELAVPRLVSTRAVGNTEIHQIYMQAAYLNGLCTLDGPTMFKPHPGHPLPARFKTQSYVIWKDLEMGHERATIMDDGEQCHQIRSFTATD